MIKGNSNPGINSKPFILHFTEPYFKKNDILISGQEIKVRIIKVYKYNFWRKILHLLGIKFKLFNCVLVEELKKE